MTPIGLDHTEWLGDTIEDIAWAKAGIIHKGATVITALQTEEAMRPILERCAEMGATLAREGSEFGVVERTQAVGGQVLTLQGLGGDLRRDLPAALRRSPGAERGARAGRGRGVPRRRRRQAARARAGPGGLRAGRLARPARAGPQRADDPARRRAQPARHGGHGQRAGGGVRVPAPGRGGRGARRQGRVRPARPARAGGGAHRGHPEQLAALDAGWTSWPSWRSRSSARTG